MSVMGSGSSALHVLVVGSMLPMALLAVGWSAFSLIISDTFNSPALYFTISTIFFIVVAVGVVVARRRFRRSMSEHMFALVGRLSTHNGEQRR